MYYRVKKQFDLEHREIDQGSYPNLRDILSLASTRPMSLSPNYSSEITIEWMQDNERSRRVISRSNLRMTHKYPSRKNNRMIYCESKHEWNTMIVLDACADVISYQEQPAIIRYRDYENNPRIHYPDVLVILRNKHHALLEIKDESEVNDPFVIWRTKHLAKTLKDFGITYLLVSSNQVSGRVKELSEELLKHSKREISDTQKENLRRWFVGGDVSFDQAIIWASKYTAEPFALICGLINSGELNLHGVSLNKESTLKWRDF